MHKCQFKFEMFLILNITEFLMRSFLNLYKNNYRLSWALLIRSQSETESIATVNETTERENESSEGCFSHARLRLKFLK